MSAHTPGPWVCEPPEDGGRVIACDARETIIHIPPCGPYNPTAAANSRLIAAAPELLAALKDVVRSCRKDFRHEADPESAFRKAYADELALIAKAEGR